MKRALIKLFIALSGLMGSLHAGPAAADLSVGPTGTHRSVRAAIMAATPGETITISPGTYTVSDVAIHKPVRLVGRGTVVFTSRRSVAKGLLVPLRGVSLTVENIIFDGAYSPDLNGAGIRHEGRLLTIRNCTFRNNENGILATGDDSSEISIEGSRFFNNGHGDGFSHGIYMSVGSRLLISNSVFEETRVGHHVKSLAEYTYITNSTFADGNGETSYFVDASKGGTLIIEDNKFVRSPTASQDNFFNYDTTRGGDRDRIVIRRNKFQNARVKGNLLRNPENVPVEYEENEIINAEGATLREPTSTGLGIYGKTLEEIARNARPEDIKGFATSRPATAAPPQDPPRPHIYTEEELAGLTPVQRRMVLQLQEQQGLVPEPETSQSPREEIRSPNVDKASHDRESAGQGASSAHPLQQGATGAPIKLHSPDSFLQPISFVAPSNAASKRDAQKLLDLPAYAPRAHPGDIVPINLLPVPGSGYQTGYVTFGQPFRESAFFAKKSGLALRVNGQVLPVQTDIKALHDNGSVRHAVLTVQIPRTFYGRAWQGMLVRTDAPSDTNKEINIPASYRLEVSVHGQAKQGDPFQTVLQLNKEVLRKANETWLSGSMVREVSTIQQTTSALRVRADMRFYADGVSRTTLIFENHKSFSAQNRDLTYDVSIGNGSQTFEQINAVRHHRASNWTKEIWLGGRPAFDVVQDVRYLRSTFAVPPLDLAIAPTRRAVEFLIEQNAQADRQPLASRLLTKYMPATGGRDDLGMVPNWSALWLKTGSPALKNVLLDQAEAGGAVPWHFAEDASGLPVRIDQHPDFWTDVRGAGGKDGQLPLSFFDNDENGWVLDLAHKPSLSALAYVITGDHKYARALSFEAAYAIASVWPEERGGSLLVVDQGQPRARAWALRDISDAAFLLPESDPLRSYFAAALAENLHHLRKTHVDEGLLDAAGEVEGWFYELSDRPAGRISPWQNDYMVMAIGLAALRGSPDASQIMLWTEHWQTGRFLADGADPALGPVAVHIARDPQTNDPYDSWSEIMTATRATPGTMDVFPDDGGGYLASAYGALAMVYSTTGSQRAIDAILILNKAFPDTELFNAETVEGGREVATMLYGLMTPEGAWASILDSRP